MNKAPSVTGAVKAQVMRQKIEGFPTINSISYNIKFRH